MFGCDCVTCDEQRQFEAYFNEYLDQHTAEFLVTTPKEETDERESEAYKPGHDGPFPF